MEGVAYLENNDFDDKGNLKIKTSKPVVILLQGSFCGYCHQFIPEYLKAANMLKNKVIFSTIQIDGNDDEKKLGNKIMKMIDAKGVPTIILYKNGKYSGTYEGPRKAEALTDYLQ